MASRKLECIAIENMFGEPVERTEYGKPRAHFLLGAVKMTRHEQDISARGQMWKESAILNHVTGAMTNDVDLIGAKLGSIELDFATIRSEQTNDQTQKG